MTRPVLLTADPDTRDDLLRLTALAGVEAEVVEDLPAGRRVWDTAPLIVLAVDLLDVVAESRPTRRDGVVVLGRDLDDERVWQRAVEVGAERVVFLPDAERWLVEALADAAEGRSGGAVVVGVLGGRGGAGATTLACALAQTAVKRGTSTVLVDADPLGGGIDVVFGAEDEPGLRWPDLAGTRGRLPAAALARSLPHLADLALLSWDRTDPVELPVEAARAVLVAAGRSHELVVVDLPRHLDAVTREVLALTTTTLLLVPAEVRATAAAARVAAQAAGLCRDLRLVVRGPAPAGLSAREVERALGVPLAAELRPEPGLARALEEGVAPGARRGSPLLGVCHLLLDTLVLPSVTGAA